MIGQEKVLEAIVPNKSYIINGVSGCGKTTLAKEIIKSFIDSKYVHLFPNNYPDFHYLEGGKIEEVQELKRKLELQPFYDRHYVLLDKMNEMTKDGQNSLLKFLEEKKITFIITSNNDSRILDTIFSRCCLITPALLDNETILNILKENFPNEDISYLNKITDYADKSLGKALEFENNETLREFIKDLSELKTFDSMVLASKYDSIKKERTLFFYLIEKYIKDKMLTSSPDKQHKYFELIKDIQKYKKHLFQNVSLKSIFRNIFSDLIDLE